MLPQEVMKLELLNTGFRKIPPHVRYLPTATCHRHILATFPLLSEIPGLTLKAHCRTRWKLLLWRKTHSSVELLREHCRLCCLCCVPGCAHVVHSLHLKHLRVQALETQWNIWSRNVVLFQTECSPSTTDNMFSHLWPLGYFSLLQDRPRNMETKVR